MTYYKKLVGDKCYLSPCTLDDAEKWTEWDNNIEIGILLGDEGYTPMSVEKQRELIDDELKKQVQLFDIVALDGDVLIGRCVLADIDQVNRQAELGIDIGEKEYWSKGYGREAIRLLLDYGFNLLNLNSVYLDTASFNERAQACYRAVGFKEIGRRRQARIIGGKKFDIVLMDILAEEFESPFLGRLIAQATNGNTRQRGRATGA